MITVCLDAICLFYKRGVHDERQGWFVFLPLLRAVKVIKTLWDKNELYAGGLVWYGMDTIVSIEYYQLEGDMLVPCL